MPFMYKSVKERFWEKVAVRNDNECWNWTGAICEGYGNFKITYKIMKAHRYSWELHNKQAIPEGMLVLHKCNNKRCVNPHHLCLGTHSDNNSDSVRDNRNKYTGRPIKLSIKDRNAIRLKYSEGNITQTVLANTYKVHQSTISDIINYRYLDER